jgi:uncharacterized protein (DUF2062 family)
MIAKLESLFVNKVKNPILGFLRDGMAPKKLSLTIAVGVSLGIVPVLGATTLLCAAAALLFRLNMPVIMLANYLVYPLQFLFLLPFIKMGEKLFGTGSFELTLDEITTVMQQGLFKSIEVLGWSTLKGFAAWIFVAPLIIGVLYLSLLPVFRVLAFKTKKE